MMMGVNNWSYLDKCQIIFFAAQLQSSTSNQITYMPFVCFNFNHLRHTCTEVASVEGINQVDHYLEGKFVFTNLIKMVALTIKRIAVSFVEVCWARV